MKKIKDFVKKNYIACTVVGALLLVVIASLIIISLININKNKIEVSSATANLYQYFGDTKTEFEAKLSYENKVLVNITSDNYKSHENTLIYNQDKTEVFIPKTSSIVFYYQQNLTYKLPKYSSVIQKDGSTFVTSNDNSKADNNFIIYDGLDTYFIPIDSTLLVNGEETKLSEYSYITANNNYVSYYDYELDKSIMIEKEIKNATLIVDDLKIDLLKDVTVLNSKVSLLDTKVDNLDIYLED